MVIDHVLLLQPARPIGLKETLQGCDVMAPLPPTPEVAQQRDHDVSRTERQLLALTLMLEQDGLPGSTVMFNASVSVPAGSAPDRCPRCVHIRTKYV